MLQFILIFFSLLLFCEISHLLSAQVSCYTSEWDLPPHDDTHNSDSETDESGFHFVCISSAPAKKVWEMCAFSLKITHSIGALKEECLEALEVSSQQDAYRDEISDD